MISSGHYFIVIMFYAGWALAVALLKNRGINKWNRLRRFAKGVWQRRIKYGAINECMWFCYISFAFFGFWQMKDLSTPYSWNYANIALSFFCWFLCILLTTWVLYLALKYRTDPSKIPKKFGFILGEDSHIPFEIPLRHIRKLLFCVFLATGKI